MDNLAATHRSSDEETLEEKNTGQVSPEGEKGVDGRRPKNAL